MKKSIPVKVSLLVSAAMAAVLLPLAGTSYAAGCSEEGCDGKGPVSYGCDGDGATKTSVTDGIMTAELRWSGTCHAGWVRGTDPYPNDNFWNHYAVIEKHSRASGNPLLKSETVTIPDGGSDWSNMVGGIGYAYRVCLRDGGTGDVVCSGYW
ncbi:DUF2690 domain-containing protein [Streptomyces sp. NPDC008222]|uniref:DUF2690 domain-containing protein n=1 Tax=Streptomyces sp. NPDC008222 TaxID=3364820 RepID=UPI0036E57CB6